MTTLNNLWSRVVSASRAAVKPTRVGVLDTGELVLVAHDGRCQVISSATTELIRDALDMDAGPPIPVGDASMLFPTLTDGVGLTD